nr:MAG TPA: hypothetical protein [Caudoviricetes sp.]DAR67870.1 MAG TPA: hypothetical protein [Caudoviricetes sp.]DAS09903.1 MAG TPA: hypothetical protein [Caudoviricetes sp.]DAV14257.1 MAG TPA: hypothetical protein [Caudoviricetes sp.]
MPCYFNTLLFCLYLPHSLCTFAVFIFTKECDGAYDLHI